MWAVGRTKGHTYQVLYDDQKVDSDGVFSTYADRPEGCILPKTFSRIADARYAVSCFKDKEPEWFYEINQYLR